MKKATLVFLAFALCVSGILFFRTGRTEAVAPRIQVRDLPEHGVRLIGPGDPMQPSVAGSFRTPSSNAVVERMKPFSVFLRNTGSRNIIAYWLTWELTKPDGTVITREEGGVNSGALTGDVAPGLEHLVMNSGYAVGRNANRFINPLTSFGESEVSGALFAYATSTEDPSEIGRLQQAARSISSFLDDVVVPELRGYAEMRVSVDGVFFDDGTFVGPDTTQFFNKVQANIDAKRDLLEEISFAVEHGLRMSKIFKNVQEVASSPDVISFTTQADYYNLHKKRYAEEVLRMRSVLGDNRAIAQALRSLTRPWPRLRKLT